MSKLREVPPRAANTDDYAPPMARAATAPAASRRIAAPVGGPLEVALGTKAYLSLGHRSQLPGYGGHMPLHHVTSGFPAATRYAQTETLAASAQVLEHWAALREGGAAAQTRS